MIKELEKYIKLHNTVSKLLDFFRIIGIASAIIMFQYGILTVVFFIMLTLYIFFSVYRQGLKIKVESIKFKIELENLHKQTMNDFFNKQRRYNNYRYGFNTKKSDYTLENSLELMGLKLNDNNLTIKKKYRELSLKWHPDKWINDITENQEIAKRNFQKLNNAYNVIKKHKNIK